MGNYHVNQILKKKKITEFLHERGIFHVKQAGGKWIYHCPIHSGDNDPSFIVYPEGTKGRDYQTYHCFGCHSGINIINLKSDLDNSSTKDSIRYFLRGMDIDTKDVRESIINDIQTGELVIEDDKKIEFLLLMINCDCRRYFFEYGNEYEIRFFDDCFFKKVDEIARNKDVETLEAYYERLIDKKVLEGRALKIKKEREEEEASAVDWRI